MKINVELAQNIVGTTCALAWIISIGMVIWDSYKMHTSWSIRSFTKGYRFLKEPLACPSAKFPGDGVLKLKHGKACIMNGICMFRPSVHLFTPLYLPWKGILRAEGNVMMIEGRLLRGFQASLIFTMILLLLSLLEDYGTEGWSADSTRPAVIAIALLMVAATVAPVIARFGAKTVGIQIVALIRKRSHST